MGQFFEGGGGSLISGAIGMVGGAISDRRNYKNQLKLMEQQQQYNKELGEINQGYAKETYSCLIVHLYFGTYIPPQACHE